MNEAERLADEIQCLDSPLTTVCYLKLDEAAAELRRLHDIEQLLCIEESLLRQANAINEELVKTLELCYDHCRLYYPEVEHNNIGDSVRQALEKAKQ